MKNPLFFLLVAFGCLITSSGCNGQELAGDSDAPLPTRRELFRAFRDQNRMLLVYGGQNAAYRDRYRALAEQMQSRIERFELLVKSDTEVTREELSTYPLLLLGTPSSNQILLELGPDLPVAFDGFCLRFDGRDFTDSSTVFCLSFYPNPLNPRLPLSLVTGLTEASLLSFYSERWSDLFWGGWNYEFYQNNQRHLMGNFSNRPDDRWQIDRASLFDLEGQPLSIRESPHYRYLFHGTPPAEPAFEALVDSAEKRFSELQLFLGALQEPAEKIPYHLYASAELKGLMVNNTEQAHVDFSQGEIYRVLSPPFEGSNPERENEWWIRHHLGQPNIHALEKGLGLTFSSNWHRQGYLYWALRLYHSGNAVALSEILDNEQFSRESPLVMEALAGSFVQFLLETWGREEFLKQYSSWQPSPTEIQLLGQKWEQWLDVQTLEEKEDSINIIPVRTTSPTFKKGFNFTHEGYEIYNGYISQRARESLAYTASLGANAAAVVPYTGMGDPHKPVWLRFSSSPGGENDESVIHSLHAARQLGMTTLLKPQVWLWQGSWPGAVEMRNDKDWELFFDYYYRWIRHYALLAEMENVDIFCAGVEFQEATLQREADWKKLFAKLRPLYSGKLTYAANWGKEFEGVGFWDDLDYIGLNCYYPLSNGSFPSQEELNKNCRKVMDKVAKVVRKYQKPLLFTEIGFRSVEEPWKQPHEEANGRAFNAEHQAMSYRAVLKAIKGRPWCEGIFWWNWGTDLNNYGEADRSFSPYGKPTEKVVKEWGE